MFLNLLEYIQLLILKIRKYILAKQFKASRNCLSPRDYNPDKPKRERAPLSEEQKAKMQAGRKSKNSQGS